MLFSSGDTKSLLHQDDADSIRCLFAGTNDIYLIEYPKYKDKVTARSSLCTVYHAICVHVHVRVCVLLNTGQSSLKHP